MKKKVERDKEQDEESKKHRLIHWLFNMHLISQSLFLAAAINLCLTKPLGHLHLAILLTCVY